MKKLLNNKPQLLLKAADPDIVYYDPRAINKSIQLLALLDVQDKILRVKTVLEMDLFRISGNIDLIAKADSWIYERFKNECFWHFMPHDYGVIYDR